MNNYKNETECWVYFCLNYPYNFIEEIWGGTYLEEHFKNKFGLYYDKVGSSGAMLKFFANLSSDNQRKLREYAMKWGGLVK